MVALLLLTFEMRSGFAKFEKFEPGFCIETYRPVVHTFAGLKRGSYAKLQMFARRLAE